MSQNCPSKQTPRWLHCCLCRSALKTGKTWFSLSCHMLAGYEAMVLCSFSIIGNMGAGSSALLCEGISLGEPFREAKWFGCKVDRDIKGWFKSDAWSATAIKPDDHLCWMVGSWKKGRIEKRLSKHVCDGWGMVKNKPNLQGWKKHLTTTTLTYAFSQSNQLQRTISYVWVIWYGHSNTSINGQHTQ